MRSCRVFWYTFFCLMIYPNVGHSFILSDPFFGLGRAIIGGLGLYNNVTPDNRPECNLRDVSTPSESIESLVGLYDSVLRQCVASAKTQSSRNNRTRGFDLDKACSCHYRSDTKYSHVRSYVRDYKRDTYMLRKLGEVSYMSGNISLAKHFVEKRGGQLPPACQDVTTRNLERVTCPGEFANLHLIELRNKFRKDSESLITKLEAVEADSSLSDEEKRLRRLSVGRMYNHYSENLRDKDYPTSVYGSKSLSANLVHIGSVHLTGDMGDVGRLDAASSKQIILQDLGRGLHESMGELVNNAIKEVGLTIESQNENNNNVMLNIEKVLNNIPEVERNQVQVKLETVLSQMIVKKAQSIMDNMSHVGVSPVSSRELDIKTTRFLGHVVRGIGNIFPNSSEDLEELKQTLGGEAPFTPKFFENLLNFQIDKTISRFETKISNVTDGDRNEFQKELAYSCTNLVKEIDNMCEAMSDINEPARYSQVIFPPSDLKRELLKRSPLDDVQYTVAQCINYGVPNSDQVWIRIDTSGRSSEADHGIKIPPASSGGGIASGNSGCLGIDCLFGSGEERSVKSSGKGSGSFLGSSGIFGNYGSKDKNFSNGNVVGTVEENNAINGNLGVRNTEPRGEPRGESRGEPRGEFRGEGDERSGITNFGNRGDFGGNANGTLNEASQNALAQNETQEERERQRLAQEQQRLQNELEEIRVNQGREMGQNQNENSEAERREKELSQQLLETERKLADIEKANQEKQNQNVERERRRTQYQEQMDRRVAEEVERSLQERWAREARVESQSGGRGVSSDSPQELRTQNHDIANFSNDINHSQSAGESGASSGTETNNGTDTTAYDGYGMSQVPTLTLSAEDFRSLGLENFSQYEGQILRVRENVVGEDGKLIVVVNNYKIVDGVPLPVDINGRVMAQARDSKGNIIHGRSPASNRSSQADFRLLEDESQVRHQSLKNILDRTLNPDKEIVRRN